MHTQATQVLALVFLFSGTVLSSWLVRAILVRRLKDRPTDLPDSGARREEDSTLGFNSGVFVPVANIALLLFQLLIIVAMTEGYFSQPSHPRLLVIFGSLIFWVFLSLYLYRRGGLSIG